MKTNNKKIFTYLFFMNNDQSNRFFLFFSQSFVRLADRAIELFVIDIYKKKKSGEKEE
jgi:hypothetical protein